MTTTRGSEPSSDPRTAAPTPGPGPAPAGPRRLYREPEEKRLAGVCGGIADHLGVDPTIVRLAVVLLTLTTWFGALLYLIAAVVVPRRPPTVPRVRAAEPLLPDGTTGPAVAALAVLAGIAMFAERPWLDLPALGILLVAAGLWMLVGDRVGQRPAVPVADPGARPADLGATPAGDPAADLANNPGNLTTARGSSTTLTGEVVPSPSTADSTTELPDPATVAGPSVPEGAASTVPQGEVPPPVPPWGLGSPTRPLGTSTRPLTPPPAGDAIATVGDDRVPRSGNWVVAVLLVGAGVVTLLDLLDLASPSFSTVVAVGLITIGGAMVVGAFRGRARWLALLGLPAIGLLVADDILTVPLDAGVGDRVVVVADDGTPTDDHDLAIGTLTLDLRDVDGDRADPPTIEASVGLGKLEVLVPDDMEARVEASVGAGAIDHEADVDFTREFTLERDPDTSEGAGRSVELDLRVDVGEVEVIHG
ncbi:MAG TPA: PspC domain-containing protein [Acidimicrobiales bacterium]